MFKNIEELKNKIVNYLKDIIKNENNKNAIELINKNGYLAAEAQGEIKIYTDKEKSKGGSLHLAYCKMSGADGRENNRYAKQFIKDNTIQSLLSAAVEEVEKDKLKLKEAESNKHLLINLQDKINNYFNSLSIDIENINVRFSDYNIEYYLNFSNSIGDKYFNIYFKLQGDQYLYNDTYKEEKHIFKNVEEILKHFINEISPAVQKKISFLKMYSIVENNFKNNIDKKILFKNKDSFYTATIDNQYITLYEVNRKKEKPVYNYLYLKQFIDLFIKDNIDRFIIIDNNTDLSIKNLRNLINSNNCIMIHEEAATDREENKNSLGAENMNNKKELKPIFNTDIEGHEEYQKEELKKYNSGALNFTHKRINNKMIEEYTKYFIYKDNTFMSVKPGKDYPSGYYDHVRKYDYKIDHVNKVILFIDKEIEEIEQIKNNLGGENMNINKERYFKSMNPGHKDFIVIDGNNAIIKHLEGSKVWKTEEKDIIKNLGHKDADAYIKHLKKFNYIEVKEDIKEEFYNNNEVEPVTEQIEDNYFYSDINLNNILKHIEEVKDFNNSKSIEYFGNYAAAQRGSFRIEKNNNNFYIKAMIEIKENYFEKLEIFETPEKAIDLYIDFLSKYQLDYIKYLESQNEQTEKENNQDITLTKEQEKERIELINLWSKKAPGDKEQGKERFLQLLFEYQEQKKTKEEFKKHINKLYAANKNIKAANAGKKDFNNYLIDLLATENILQQNDIIKNEFFTNAYNYIKSVC